MASNINATQPITGIDQPVQVVRDNFAFAKLEIEDLQLSKVNRNGDIMVGILQFAPFIVAAFPDPSLTPGGVLYNIDASAPFFSDGVDWLSFSSIAVSLINDIGDVNVGVPGAPQDGFLLTWNDSFGEFRLQPAPSGGLSNIVDDTTPELGGELNALTNKIVTLGAPTASTDAATKGYVDTEILALTAIDEVIEDSTPQLGGNLDVNGSSIVSVSGGDINITPDTSGSVVLDGLNWPQADGTDGQVLTTDGAGNLAFEDVFDGFDIAFFISGSPSSSQIVGQFVVVRAVDFPTNLTDSQGFASTAATASTDFDIQKNGGSIGTMNFDISGTVATFTFGSPVSFAAGDRFQVVAPGSPDSTLADISMTFKGVRT